MESVVWLPWAVLVRRLIVAFVLGAIIGLERERRERPAGLRTHILVTTGAALLMMLSELVAGESFDPGRIAAAVVTGMGFLGAGTIIRYGTGVRGLTTAASLWAAAAVGLAIGFGWYLAGIVTTVLIFITLTLIRRLEPLIAPDAATMQIMVKLVAGCSLPADLVQRIEELGGQLHHIEFVNPHISEGLQIALSIKGSPGLPQQILAECLSRQETIDSARIV